MSYPLHEAHTAYESRRIGSPRVEQWIALYNKVLARQSGEGEGALADVESQWLLADHASRTAREEAVEALYWLDDVIRDADRGLLLDLDSFGRAAGLPMQGVIRFGDLYDHAHKLAHQAAELVGGLFGCKFSYNNDGGWATECPLTVMHIRLGLSIGSAVTYACTICRRDASSSECTHIAGEIYHTKASIVAGVCNICWPEDACDHSNGEYYPLRVGRRIISGPIREVSLVPRPSDPLCRITRVEFDANDFVERFGFEPQPDTTIFCHDCLYPCQGFTD